MSQTYYTQTLTSDGSSLALSDATQASSPYITYNCKSPVNLNFLFREVLFCDPEAISVNPDDPLTGSSKVHIVPTYLDQTTAETSNEYQRYSDVSGNYGQYYAMRLINAIVRNEMQLPTPEQTILNSYIKHFGGYEDGLVSGTAINSGLASTSTMDFAEFFQVALSAIRNKDTDSLTTSTNGLVDRENINNAAVADDLLSRTVTNMSASDLLKTMLNSSRQPNTFANGIIHNTSSVNWMKQLIYSIIIQSQSGNGSSADGENDERYTPIKRSGISNNEQERFLQLRLRDGDHIVLVFQFNVSKDDGTLLSNDRPDQPGVPITIGYKIQHSDTATDFIIGDTGTNSILPIGWVNSYESLQPPSNLQGVVNPNTFNVELDWQHPITDLSDAVMYTATVFDTYSNINYSSNVYYDPLVNSTVIGPVSPGVTNLINLSLSLKYNIGGTIYNSFSIYNDIYSVGNQFSVFNSIKNIATDLNQLTGINKFSLGNAQSVIESHHPSFNTFAVVAKNDVGESLTGYSSQDGTHQFTYPGFVYNTSNNKLSTGNTISDMEGTFLSGMNNMDGLKWMAMALYDGSNNGFKGILVWIFTGDNVTINDNIINSAKNFTNTASIFYPDNSFHVYNKIHQIVVDNNGSIEQSHTSNVTNGFAGWNLSNAQNPSNNGYYNTNRFSMDDALWGFQIGEKLEGNYPGPYITSNLSNKYGAGNSNSADFTANKVYWNSVQTNTSNWVGFVFTSDK